MFRPSLKESSLVYVTIISVLAVMSTASARADDASAKRATPAVGGQRAEIILNVPLDAIVFIDGQRITSGGTTRLFVTPSLTPGRRYFYDVKISWIDGSHAREISKQVSFQAGQRVVLNYARPNWRETAWDLYLDPNAPNPSGWSYYQDPLIYPYYINPSFVFPGYRFYPR
jgi:uncharacterized protein (TIGR03000 family)